MDFTNLSTAALCNMFYMRQTSGTHGALKPITSSEGLKIYETETVTSNEPLMAVLAYSATPEKKMQLFIEEFNFSIAGSDVLGLGWMTFYKNGFLLLGVAIDASNICTCIGYHRIVDATFTHLAVIGSETITSGDSLYIEATLVKSVDPPSVEQNFRARVLAKVNGAKIGGIKTHTSPGPLPSPCFPSFWLKPATTTPASYFGPIYEIEISANKVGVRSL